MELGEVIEALNRVDGENIDGYFYFKVSPPAANEVVHHQYKVANKFQFFYVKSLVCYKGKYSSLYLFRF